MRVMLMIKGDPEPGARPSEELLAAMGRYNEELKEAGVLVDPLDEDALAAALSAAAALPRPNLAGRKAAEAHDVRLQAGRVEQILLRAVADRQA